MDLPYKKSRREEKIVQYFCFSEKNNSSSFFFYYFFFYLNPPHTVRHSSRSLTLGNNSCARGDRFYIVLWLWVFDLRGGKFTLHTTNSLFNWFLWGGVGSYIRSIFKLSQHSLCQTQTHSDNLFFLSKSQNHINSPTTP